MSTHVGDTCEVVCDDNGKRVQAEILKFQERQTLNVSLQRTIRLEMKWNGKVYEGRSSGLSFSSIGPKITLINDGRARR
jgi:hypothetical protein